MSTTILTPVGRLVQGDVFKGSDKDPEGRPYLIKNGPNTGQPRKDYYIGLAIPKTDPGWPELLAKITDEAKKGFPALFATGTCSNPAFSFKYMDGDDPKHAGKEGFQGHYILKMSSGFAPKVFSKGGATELTDPESCKRGYYLRAYGSVVGNGATMQPGVYVNLNMVEVAAFGEEISSGPDGASIFGGEPITALPAGAKDTPAISTPPIAPPVAAVSTPVTPPTASAPDYLKGPSTPPVAPVAPVAPVHQSHQMTAKAGGHPYEAFIKLGHTDVTLRAQGLMI